MSCCVPRRELGRPKTRLRDVLPQLRPTAYRERAAPLFPMRSRRSIGGCLTLTPPHSARF